MAARGWGKALGLSSSLVLLAITDWAAGSLGGGQPQSVLVGRAAFPDRPVTFSISNGLVDQVYYAAALGSLAGLLVSHQLVF